MNGTVLETKKTALLLPVVVAIMFLASVTVLVAVSEPASAAFPGQNGAIAFVRVEEAQCGNVHFVNASPVYRMDPNGSNEMRLSDPCTTDSFIPPAWSPDGERLAFGRMVDRTEVWTMDPNGSGLVQVTDNRMTEENVAWFPSGRKIAFDGYGQSYNIYVQPLGEDGTQSGRFTSLTRPSIWRVNRLPAVSPGGKKIAFNRVGGNSGNDSEIIVMRANRREGPDNRPMWLTDNKGIGDYSAAWSPDGKKIAYYKSDWRPWRDSEIWVMNSDGSNKTRLTNQPDAASLDPAWSPDGKKITFSSDRDGDFEIYVMKPVPEGANNIPVQLTNNDVDDLRPDWQPLP